jgi:hypothetical protein
LPEIETRLGLNFHLERFTPHAVVSILVLSLPAILPLLAQGMIWLVYRVRPKIKPRKFSELAYGYLPLVLAGNLAHYLRLWLNEAGRILPISFATFGLNGNGLPILVAHPAVIAFLQGTTLIVGVLLSIILTQKIARQPLRLLLPQHLITVVLAIGMWQVIVGF